MKSTDMFLSASSRKYNATAVILPDKIEPEGKAFSSHIISLWEHFHQKQNIKKIFHKEKNNKEEKREIFTSHSIPESQINIPSRKEQIEKVKQAMKRFEEMTEKYPQSSGNGFFRNLKRFI